MTSMKGLFKSNQFKNPKAEEKWRKKEIDKLLDFYLTGADLGRIAVSLQRNRKAIVRKLQEYIYNERDRVTNYQPRQRISRTGKRLTENERQIIKECRKKKVSDSQIAAVLARSASDFSNAPMEVAKSKSSVAPFASTLELVLAHRYIYHVYKTPIISDTAYDIMKEEEEEYGGGSKALIKEPKGCPTYVKILATYLMERDKFLQENKE